MKGPLLRSLFVRYRKILLSMTLIASLCTGISVGMVNVYRSLTRTFDRYVNDYGVADAVRRGLRKRGDAPDDRGAVL